MSYYIPAIIRETSEGTVRVPIADMMFQRREVWLTGEINSEVADAVISQILHLDAEDPDAEIVIYINSPGGSVTAGLSIYDVMQAVSADIHTVCVGTAASMAAVLFAAGDRREDTAAWGSDDTRPAGVRRHLRQRPDRAGQEQPPDGQAQSAVWHPGRAYGKEPETNL